MDQSLSATAGTGNLLNIGTTAASTVGAGGAVAQASEQGFGVTMLQAQQQGQSGERQQAGDAGQDLPVSGQIVPQSGVPEVEAVEPVNTAGVEGSGSESRLQPDLFAKSRIASQSDVEGDQVLQQIGRYQKADLSVAVDSALQQYSGKSPVVELPKGVDAAKGVPAVAVQDRVGGLPASEGSSRAVNADLVLAQLDSARNASKPGELISAVAGQHGVGRQDRPVSGPDKAVPESTLHQAKVSVAANVVGQQAPDLAVPQPNVDSQAVPARQQFSGVELSQSYEPVTGRAVEGVEPGFKAPEQQRSAEPVSKSEVINVPASSAVDPTRVVAETVQATSAADVTKRQLFGDPGAQLRADPEKGEAPAGIVLNRQGEVAIPVTGEILQSRIDEVAKEGRKVQPDPVAVPQSFSRANDNGGIQVTQLRPASASVNSPPPESNPSLVTAATQDSTKVQAKPDLADPGNSSRLQVSSTESSGRSELRQDSFLASFADSLAAAKTIR